MMEDVKDVIKDFIKESDYDGLYNIDGECACELSDLQPCGENFSDCILGIKKKYDELTEEQKTHSDGACDFFIVKKE